MDEGVYDDVTCARDEEYVEYFIIELDETGEKQEVESIIKTEKNSDSNLNLSQTPPRTEKQTQSYNSNEEQRGNNIVKIEKESDNEDGNAQLSQGTRWIQNQTQSYNSNEVEDVNSIVKKEKESHSYSENEDAYPSKRSRGVEKQTLSYHSDEKQVLNGIVKIEKEPDSEIKDVCPSKRPRRAQKKIQLHNSDKKEVLDSLIKTEEYDSNGENEHVDPSQKPRGVKTQTQTQNSDVEEAVDIVFKTEKHSDSNNDTEDVYESPTPQETPTQTHSLNSRKQVKTKAKKRTSSEKIYNGQKTCKFENNKTQNKNSKHSCPRKINLDKKTSNAYNQNESLPQETMFIRASASVKNVHMDITNPECSFVSKDKKYQHIYTLKDENGIEQEVSRDVFLKNLLLTKNRKFSHSKPDPDPIYFDATKSKSKPDPVPENIPLDLRLGMQKFIDLIPKYEPRYSNSFSEGKFLHHSLNLKSIYNEYKRVCDLKKEPLYNERDFRRIFNNEYKLFFKRRQSDSCRICIRMVSPAELGDGKALLHEKHCSLVKATSVTFVDDIKRARGSNGKRVVLTFDLQSTLDTPSLFAQEMFYKRPLWTYNFCVYNEVEKKVWMYVWSENIASRGGQEIGSCLLKHLKQYISTNVTEIILYSDPCGGQNQNIKLTMILKKFLHEFCKDNNLSTIQQKYFVPGHSFTNCSRRFAMIESERQKTKAILYTPSDWFKFIDCLKIVGKVKVTVMQEEDFFSSANLISLIRKSQVPWLNFKTITYCKNEPYILQAVSQNGSIFRADLKKCTSTIESLSECELQILYPDGRPISKPKYNDLIELLKYIPPELHEFYRSLKYDDKKDYGLASDISDDEESCELESVISDEERHVM